MMISYNKIKWIIASIAVFWVIACDEATNQKTATSEREHVVGTYLSFMHAERNNDYARASNLAQNIAFNAEELDLFKTILSVHIAASQMGRALDVADNILAHEKDYAPAHMLIGIDMMRKKSYRQVLQHMNKINSEGLYLFLVPIIKAWAYVGLDEQEKALNVLNQALTSQEGDNGGFEESAPFNTVFEGHKALIYAYFNDYSMAESILSQLIKTQDNISFRLMTTYGNLLNLMGKVEEAKQFYQDWINKTNQVELFDKILQKLEQTTKPKLLVASPQQGVADGLHMVASTLKQHGSLRHALLYAQEALYLHFNADYVLYLVGNIWEGLDDYAAANQAYFLIPSESPLYSLVQVSVAENQHHLEDNAAAIATLKQLLQVYPNFRAALTLLGDLYRDEKQYAQAISVYSQVIDLIKPPYKPQDAHIFYSRGVAHERQKQWSASEKDLLKALELYPDQPLILNYLGYSWIDQGVHLNQALEMVKKAVSLSPHDGFINDSLGWAYYKLHEYEKAVEYLEKAVHLEAADPIINDHLGDVYWQLGRFIEAKFQWQRALDLKPEPELKETLQYKIEYGLKVPAKN